MREPMCSSSFIGQDCRIDLRNGFDRKLVLPIQVIKRDDSGTVTKIQHDLQRCMKIEFLCLFWNEYCMHIIQVDV